MEPPQTAQNIVSDYYLSRGVLHLRSGDFRNAEADLEHVEPNDTNRGDLALAHWQLMERQGNSPEAEAAFLAFLSSSQDPNIGRLKAAEFLREIEEYEQALALIEEAEKAGADPFHVAFQRGETLSLLGYHERALTEFESAVRLDDKSSLALHRRGRAHLAMDDLDLALADLNRAVAIDPKNADAYLHRGVVYHLSGQSEKAHSDLNSAIEQDANDLNKFFIRGILLLNDKKNQAALADFDRMIAIDPSLAVGYALRGTAYEGMDYRREAYDIGYRHLDPALVRTPDNLIWNDWLSHDEELLDEAIEMDPRSPSALVVKANKHLFFDSLEEEFDALEAALERIEPEKVGRTFQPLPDHEWFGNYYIDATLVEGPKYQFDKGQILARQSWSFWFLRDYRAAIDKVEQIFEIDENHWALSKPIGCRLLGKVGRSEEALRVCDQKIRLDPHDQEARQSRAFVRWQLNDIDGACEDIKQVRDSRYLKMCRTLDFDVFRHSLANGLVAFLGYDNYFSGTSKNFNLRQNVRDYRKKHGLDGGDEVTIELLEHMKNEAWPSES